MARVRSEGYGAEWIEVPNEVLSVLGTHPPYADELIFFVSRSDECLVCTFLLEKWPNGDQSRDMVLSTSWPTTKIPAWVCLGGVPQFLFDNLLLELLRCERALADGYVFVPKQLEARDSTPD